MARYIDAELLKKNIRVNLMPNVDIDGTVTVENAERYFLNLIDKTSTADVAEVVRCRNCKHAYFRYNTKDTLQEIYACKKRPVGRTHKKVSGDFFCKHGEKEE